VPSPWGLGAYLAAVTDRDHYKSEEKREREEVCTETEAEMEEIHEILSGYGISAEASQMVVDCLAGDQENWIRFMMDFELKLEKSNASQAWISAATMRNSYFIGAIIPLYLGLEYLNLILSISRRLPPILWVSHQ
ncbi:beta-galactosidase, partial [Aspergillus udagawae]